MRRVIGSSAGTLVVSFNRDKTKARAALLDRDGWEFRSRVGAAEALMRTLADLGIPEDEAERLARETLSQLAAF